MNKIVKLLADWHRLYKELEQARLRLQAEPVQCSADSAPWHLQLEVSRLREESDSALAMFQAALQSRRPAPRAGALEASDPGVIALAQFTKPR